MADAETAPLSFECLLLNDAGVASVVQSKLPVEAVLRLLACSKDLSKLRRTSAHVVALALRRRGSSASVACARCANHALAVALSGPTHALTFDGHDDLMSDSALAQLCRRQGGALKLLDVTGLCPPHLPAGGDDEDEAELEAESITAEALTFILSGEPPPGLTAANLTERRTSECAAAAVPTALDFFASIAARGAGRDPQAPRRSPLAAVAARAAAVAAAPGALDPVAVAALSLPPGPPLASLRELVLWRPAAPRCLPLSPVQAVELAAACAALPLLSAVRVLVYETEDEVGAALTAAAAFPAPGSAVGLLFVAPLSTGSLRALAAALLQPRGRSVAWVEAGVKGRAPRAAAALRAAAAARAPPVALTLKR